MISSREQKKTFSSAKKHPNFQFWKKTTHHYVCLPPFRIITTTFSCARFHNVLASRRSPRVIHTVVQRFGAPQRVRVIELEKIDALAWVHMTATVYFLMTITPIYRYDLVGGWSIVGLLAATFLHITLALTGATCAQQNKRLNK